ncbi:MAG: D-alanyl-D-alanine dipeptidase [Rhodospirillaceae bacterium]|nr:D-alanyl-D-alanine dipeptidase [Rhodospirillaceae bacterium]
MSLVKISEDAYGIEIDLKYATSDNFTGKPVYARAECYLHEVAAHHLKIAADLAAEQGWIIRLYDAFRPSEAQWKLWNHTPDPEFLADPRRGSPHSRGVAVDLTLVNPTNEIKLDMGTGFDAFTPKSYHGSAEISPKASKNRLLLMGLMTTAGWDFYRNEWWHYQLFESADYPLLGDDALDEPLTAPD